MCQTEVVEKIKTHILHMLINVFFEHLVVYEILTYSMVHSPS